MAIVRWRPINGMTGIQDEINRTLADFWQESHDAAAVTWRPAVDVRETEDEFQVIAELPGLTKDQVKISLTDNVLTLSGEKKAESAEDQGSWHQVERSYGVFERRFRLRFPVTPDQIKARFENGVLTVMLPKAEDAKPREIPIDM